MFTNQCEEHLRDSAPDNSRWDGFDRGDTGIARTRRTCIGRLTGSRGQRVAVWQEITEDGWGDSWCEYVVTVDGQRVAGRDHREDALRLGRQLLSATCH